MNDEISNDGVETEWSSILEEEWSHAFISLTGAVWWIATGGDAEGRCRDSEEDQADLDSAAARLFNRLEAGELKAFGIRHLRTLREEVPCEHFECATPFFGEAPDGMLNSATATLHWNSMLDGDWRTGENSDMIRTLAEVSWRRLAIKKADLLAVFLANEREATESHQSTSVESTETKTLRLGKKQNKPDKIAAWLREKHPVRPSMTNPELMRIVQGEAGGIGDFSDRTFAKAIQRAYGC